MGITLFILRAYLFMRERQRHRQREKQAPCKEPDMGLDPGTPESCPGLQAALNRCTTGAALNYFFNTDFSGSSIFSAILTFWLLMIQVYLRNSKRERVSRSKTILNI